ncbi:Trigger factor [Senna tora]|uniref:Trigger factor n=1 Tax=Senna tora TaxID=362788 RepID=A0A834W7U2_9FABA|nr:Trigger factor [Senna tora]
MIEKVAADGENFQSSSKLMVYIAHLRPISASASSRLNKKKKKKEEMEDVITEIPPPSRFFEEDLNNFTPPSPTLPSPFLLFSHPHPPQPLQPSLLIIALSSPSLYLLHTFPKKTLIASLILPEIPSSGNSIQPSLTDNTINIYSLDSHDALLVAVQSTVSPERSHSVAKLLIGDRIAPKRVVVLGSIRIQNYRGRLSSDEAFAYKLETSSERKSVIGEKLLKGLEYYPSGSVVDGLSAALLGRCQILNIRGVLCVSWPEFDASVVSLIKGLLQKDVLPGLDLSSSDERSDELPLKFGRSKDHHFESDLYT